MDRQIVYPGSIPLDTDILSVQRNTMVALGYLAQAALGTNAVADGLSCSATVPASMSVSIGPGSITQFADVDTAAFGSLPALPTTPLVKMGINLSPVSFQLTAPASTGQAITYLIEGSLLEADGVSVVLPYYNASNPAQPYSGPSNDGTSQNTQRTQRVQLQLKAGPPGSAGSQQTPTVDAGWVGLYTIVVQSGQTAITAANIATLPTAPFLSWKLPQLTPGVKNLQTFTPATQGNFAVPASVWNVRVRLWSGGGAGGAGFGGAGGGGAGGGYFEGYLPVTPGQIIAVGVGNGGIGSGAAGGNSSFGTFASATGGGAGANGSASAGGAGAANGGSASGPGLSMSGSAGSPAVASGTNWLSGTGGGAFGGSGAAGILTSISIGGDGHAATLPGAGGAGGVGSGVGGQGGAGLVLVEW